MQPGDHRVQPVEFGGQVTRPVFEHQLQRASVQWRIVQRGDLGSQRGAALQQKGARLRRGQRIEKSQADIARKLRLMPGGQVVAQQALIGSFPGGCDGVDTARRAAAFVFLGARNRRWASSGPRTNPCTG